MGYTLLYLTPYLKIGKKPDKERNEVEKKLVEQNKNAKYLGKGFERDDGFER